MENNDDSSAPRVGVQDLYAEATANIRFSKQQQWIVSHYLLIFYAAIYWGHSVVHELVVSFGCCWVETVDVLAILTTMLTAVSGWVFMRSHLGFLQRQRQRLNRIYDGHADGRFLTANLERGDKKYVDTHLYRDKHMWVPLTSAQVLAASWLVVVIVI